jgi:hypothetical protein
MTIIAKRTRPMSPKAGIKAGKRYGKGGKICKK